MTNFIAIIIITTFVTIVGGGLGYLFYIKTRPKKETWKANVYQLGGGTKVIEKDSNGKIITPLSLKDLRPYAKDILEKVPKDYGSTVYRLQKLDITTNPVTAEDVEVWGKSGKEVDILIVEGIGIVLKKGYETKTGNAIYLPKPRDHTETMKSEMLNKKDKLKKEKDILQAITPWIVAGILTLGFIAIVYIGGEAFTQMSENLNDGMKYVSDKNQESIEISNKALEDNIMLIINAKNIEESNKEDETIKETPPLIE